MLSRRFFGWNSSIFAVALGCGSLAPRTAWAENPSTREPSAASESAAPADAAAAAQAAPGGAASAEAAPSTEPIAEQVITINGTAAARSASQVTLTKRVLLAAPHKNTSELLLVVPGVFVSQHSGEGKAHQIFFRGFDAVHGQDVEFWAAGAPVNEVSNIHGQGYADLHFIIPEVVRELRATPGNYDPKQGDFAVAGSMNFDLGYDEPGFTTQASLGSFGTRRYLLAYHPKDTDPANFGAFEFYSTDGFGPSRAARHGSGMVQVARRFDSVSARLMASTYSGRFDSAGVLRLDDIERGAVDRFATYDPKQGGFSSRTQVVAELASERTKDGQFADGWSVSPFVVFRDLKLRSDFTGLLISKEGDSFQQLNSATTLGARASYRRAVSLFSSHDALEAGVSLRADSIEQSQHRLSLLDDRVTDDKVHPGIQAKIGAVDAAGYLDAALHPLRRVTLRGGLRVDSLSYTAEDTGGTGGGQERTSAGGQLSKRGTLDVVVLPGTHALLSYGEGFRSPQARSLSEGETTPFTRVVSVEGGLSYRESTRFQAAIAAFRTSLSDDLVFDQATARNELVPGTSRTGFTANLKAEPNTWFVSNTSFTYARAKFDESSPQYQKGDLLPYVPQYVVRVDLALTPDLGRLFGYPVQSHFGVGMTFLGNRPLPYAEMGHDVFLTDVSAGVRVGPIRTEFDVFNAFDADWYDGEFVYASSFAGKTSLVPARHVSVGAPRTLLWSLAVYL